MIENKLKSHLLNLYLIALSDNDFDKRELNTILKIAEERGISKDEFEKIIINPTSIDFYIPKNTMERIEFLYDFVKIIMADEKIDDEEVHTFERFCKKFEFDIETARELFSWLIELEKQNTSYDELRKEVDNFINAE